MLEAARSDLFPWDHSLEPPFWFESICIRAKVIHDMVAGLCVDENHRTLGDDGTIPVDVCIRFSGQTHGRDGVVSRSFLHDRIDVWHSLDFERLLPGNLDVGIVSVNVCVCSILA